MAHVQQNQAPTNFTIPPHPEALSFEVPRASLKREVDTLRTPTNPLLRVLFRPWAFLTEALGEGLIAFGQLRNPLAGVA